MAWLFKKPPATVAKTITPGTAQLMARLLARTQIKAPTLTASTASQTAINITATPPAGFAVDGYAYEWSADGSTGWTAFAGATASTQLTGVPVYTLRYIRARCYIGTVYSAYSAAVSARTYANAPSAPTLTATPQSSSQISLLATASSPAGIATYTFEWATSTAGPWTLLATQAGNSITHSGLPASTARYYRALVTDAQSPALTSSYSATASATTLPGAAQIMSWNTGYYVRSDTQPYSENLSSLLAELDAIRADVGANIQGVILTLPWGDLERTKGDYSAGFAMIDALLARCVTLGYRAIFVLKTRKFGGASVPGVPQANMRATPDYLISEGHVFVCSDGGGEGAALHRSYVMDRVFLLLQALGARYNSHPNVEAMNFGELSYNMANDTAQWSNSNYIDQLNRLCDALQGYFPNKPVFPGINYVGGEGQTESYAIRSMNLGNGMSGPDAIRSEKPAGSGWTYGTSWGAFVMRGYHWNGTAWVTGTNPDRHLEVASMYEMQGPPFSDLTAANYADHAADVLKCTHFAYTRFPGYGVVGCQWSAVAAYLNNTATRRAMRSTFPTKYSGAGYTASTNVLQNNPPTWNGTPAPSFTVGFAASYSLTTLVTDPESDAITLTSIGSALPAGVTINNSTRALDYSGAGAAGVTSNLRLRASASGGSNDSAAFSITLTANTSNYPTTFDYYLSPTGSDSANGLTSSTPWKTFNKAFTTMQAGKRLGLLDGTYSSAAGTGAINHIGTGASNQIPNGSAGAFTEICSVNPGGAIIDGTGGYNGYAIFVGRLTRHDSYIKFRGMKCLTSVALYNCDHIYVKDVGAKFGFGIGTNDTNGGVTVPSSFNLIEDCWGWGGGPNYRLASSNYQSHNNVWRRVVLRKDGGGPTGGGNPNVVFTVYNSKNCSVQNVISIDRILGGEQPYADFATAQHDGTNPDTANFYLGGNEWLGCICTNSQDSSYYFEADTCEAGLTTWKIRNCVGYPGEMNLSPATFGPPNGSADVQNVTMLSGQIRIRNMPLPSVLKNSIVANSTLWGVNADSAVTASYVDRYNNTNGDLIAVANGFTLNPLAGSPPPLKYICRIEAGSALKGVGEGGADVGANVEFRYGTDGAFQGDAGYNTLTSVPLWPWPNEARIKADMAADSTRGFCAAGETLTHYVWNRLGGGSPY